MGWSVREAKEKVDAEEFEAWKCFYHFNERGGPRSPDAYIADILSARSLCFQINSNKRGCPVDVRECMLYPPKVSEEEIENKRRIVAAQISMISRPVPIPTAEGNKPNG